MKTGLLDIPQDVYNKVLDVFMPSEEMRDYLRNKILWDDDIQEMILGSPVSLYLKREWMIMLSRYEFLEEDDNLAYCCRYESLASEIGKALDNLENPTSEEIFVLEDCWYDYDIFEGKNCLSGVFTNVEDVKQHILQIEDEENGYSAEDDVPTDTEIPTWRELTKYVVKNNKIIYIYYFIHDEVIWFDSYDQPEEKEHCDKTFKSIRSTNFMNSIFLQLPIPYRPGDAIEINTYPFGPIQKAIIYEILDGGRIVEMITRDYKGNWISTGLFCGHFGRFVEQTDYTSPLYRICRAIANDEEEKEVFKYIWEYVADDNDNGERLFQAVTKKGKYSTEEILLLIKELSNK